MAAPVPRWTPEAAVLKPIEISSDPDAWPQFTLSDVSVFRADGTTLVNALLVGEEGPFLVRGRLEVDEDADRSRFFDPDFRSANIEISSSILYSLGYDPLPLAWVSGRAGWFMISPSAAYAPIYKDICDVSLLYHHLLEIYETAVDGLTKAERRTVYASLGPKQILFEYAAAVGDGITYAELVDQCVRLGPLLLAHCLRTNDIPWRTTAFYKWLTREIHDRDRSDRRSSRGVSDPIDHPAATPSSPAPLPSTSPTPTAAATALSSQELPLRAPPASRPIPPPTPPETDDTPMTLPDRPELFDANDPTRAAVFALLLQGVVEIGRDFNGTVAAVSQSRVHAKLYNKFRLKHYTGAKDLSACFAAELLTALGPRWQTSGYAKWLRASIAAGPFVPVSPGFSMAEMSAQLVRRVGLSTPRASRPRSTVPHPSAATPRAPSRSGTPGTPSTPGTPDGPHSATAGKSVPPAPGTRRGGKHAGLRPPVASKKRPRDAAFDDDGSSSASASEGEARDMGSHNARRRKLADDAGSLASDSPAPDHVHPDLDSDSDSDGPATARLVVRSLPLLQSTAPTGPNRTWRCPQPGCDFFVRDAGPNFGLDDDETDDDHDDESHDHVKIAQELVRQHMRGHEQDTLNKVDLAITEGTRRHVSVSHLLEKIRSMGEKKPGKDGANRATMPNPIVGRFLV